jgi:hypothetical protein
MIASFDHKNSELKEIVEIYTNPEDCAKNLKELDEFRSNVAHGGAD